MHGAAKAYGIYKGHVYLLIKKNENELLPVFYLGLPHIHLHSCSLLQTERDNSVRQKAIDLLYAMCDVTNSETIVAELLSYLGHADYSVREALVSSTEFVCITLSRITDPWKIIW